MNLTKRMSSVAIILTLLTLGLSSSAQAALVTVQVRFIDSSGASIQLGDAKWALNDNSASSSSAKQVSAEGVVIFPYVKPGIGKVYISHGNLTDGSTVNATWLNVNLVGGSEIVLQLNREPTRVKYDVKAVFPDGSPVANTTITETGLYQIQSLCDSQTYTFFGYKYYWGEYLNSCEGVAPPTFTFVTDDNGHALVEGYLINSSVTAYATFTDSEINQSSSPVTLLTSQENLLELEFMPIVEVPSSAVQSSVGALVSVTVSVSMTSGGLLRPILSENPRNLIPATDVSLSVSNPDGTRPKKCGTKKTVMSGKTNASGRVVFKICALKSGRYSVAKNGVGTGKQIKILAKKSKPTEVRKLSARAVGANKVQVAWSQPEYTGGIPVSKYVIQAISGTTVKTFTIKAGSTAFKARKLTLSKLTGDTMWAFSAIATNKSGSSPIIYTSKGVIVSNIG